MRARDVPLEVLRAAEAVFWISPLGTLWVIVESAVLFLFYELKVLLRGR